VPPVTEAVKVTGLPTVGEGLTVKLAARGRGLTATVCVAVPDSAGTEESETDRFTV